MNLSTVAMLLLAWQLLGGGNDKGETMTDKLGAMLSDDSKALVGNIQKLSDANATAEDKTGAVLGLVTNPTVMSIADKLLGNKQSETGKPLVNDEGYNLGTPSVDSAKFFSEIDNVADAEVKSKLYKWYDWQYRR